MIPSDNDSSDSESDMETGVCKMLICSRKSAATAPGKESDDKVCSLHAEQVVKEF